jgi:class 3 adenylate cyclase
MLDALLDGQVLQRPGWLEVAEIGVTLAAGLLLIVVLPLVGARWTVVVLVATLALVVGTSLWAFVAAGMLVDPLYPSATALATFLLMAYIALTAEARQRLEIRTAFGRYLSPALVARLGEEPGRLGLGGETRDLTLLFSDIRGFTTLSEAFRDDPQGLTQLLNRYLTPMTDAILTTDGTIDKYMGDGVMAFWNAPLDDPDHARNACRAALAMRSALARLNDELAAEAGDRLGERALAEARRAIERDAGGTDLAGALAVLRELAERGSAEAQYQLARAYRDGRGVEISAERAARWFREAAMQGFGRAQRNLGLGYLDGVGVPRDPAKAYMWLSLAADSGFDAEAVPLLPLRNVLTPEQRRAADVEMAGWRPMVSDRRRIRLEIGVGIASGSCTVGNLGSERRFDYSALGDPVNLAARLEAQTRRYGVDVIVPQTTVDRSPELAFLEIDLLQVVGRREATRIFTLVGDEAMAASAAFIAQREAHRRFLDGYRDQRWDWAEAEARRLAGNHPDLRELYGTYMARIERYREQPPPPDWDGVYRSATK